MQPLEGFYYFTQVVDKGGFAKASRALGIPKSRLSRHVAALETRLGVRLVTRSTRRFVVSEVGREVYQHATAMLAAADAALEVVEFARAKPCGTLRASCPVALAQAALAPLLPEFLERYPAIRLELHVSNRRVDVLAESFDVALRVRTQPTGEDGLVMRTFREVDEFLVASPAYLGRSPALTEPAQLKEHTTLDYAGELDRRPWELFGPQGQSAAVEHRARIVCHDFVVLRAAALAGLGVARLPESVVREDLASGALTRVLVGWHTPQGIVHVVFPTRRGMLPAVRAFIDFLAERLAATL
ncbi:MAG TPA: LysR substrate-binding domain-containing protein [Steroidobacteraceae bacterium]|jgi:DNA-binding transcriptional LysR family regulator|nr:LysR substrate-binding domain-containing protein [Steroidobacteraceae bacterium]